MPGCSALDSGQADNPASWLREGFEQRVPEKAMTAISHITLELAREPGHPEGDSHHLYHLYVPLKTDGHIDAAACPAVKALCHVRRQRPGEAEVRGQVVHGPRGRWLFDYSDATARDDEVGYHFRDEAFIPGEYVSILEDDGRQHTFRVTAVRRT
jgi:hypothetical protein